MSISELKHVSESAQRIEVFTRHGRRRSWTNADKVAIVAESYDPGASVCNVARRHGLTPQQLFTWRREARKAAEAVPAFVPAVIAPEPVPAAEPPAASPRRKRRSRRHRRAAANELEASGVTVRISEGASPT